MIIHRDKSPEERSEYETLLARSELVEVGALSAQASLYGEFASTWSDPAEARSESVRTVHGVGDVIDHAFLKANLETQKSQLATDRAVDAAQRRVMEAFDEFSA